MDDTSNAGKAMLLAGLGERCGMLDHLPGIESDEGAARAGRQCFIMSMMIVIDETVTDKYRTASFVDFLEVLARMANDSAG